jgi:hypothetical protein
MSKMDIRKALEAASEGFRKDADDAQKASAKAKDSISHAYNRGRADALLEAARWFETMAPWFQIHVAEGGAEEAPADEAKKQPGKKEKGSKAGA